MHPACSIAEVLLDPRRLPFLLAVGRHGGVLAAADELAVTPSAVSQQLAKLERETGRTLLRRTPSGSVLTPAGLALAEAAEEVERTLALARSRLEHDDQVVSGKVRIGGFQSFLSNVLAPALPEWHARHPSLVIEAIEAEESELVTGLRAGTLDATIVELDAGEGYAPPRGTTDVPLLDEPWKLVVPSGALLATDVVDIARVGLPWLGVDPTAASAQAVDRVRRRLGGDTSSLHTYSSVQYALALVSAGEGVTLLPSLALEGLSTDGVDALTIPGLGLRRVVLRHLTRGRAASPSLVTAVSLIREASASFSYEASGL